MRRTKRKKLVTLLSAGISATFCTAQPFEPREPFGEPYGFQWNLVLNQGQTFDLGDNWRSDVAIQSVGTTPSLYLFRNSGMGFTYADPVTGQVVRIDLRFTGEMAALITPELYHETGMVTTSMRRTHHRGSPEWLPENTPSMRTCTPTSTSMC